MDTPLNQTVTEVLTLPKHVRAYLADVLLESLDYEEDFQMSTEWMDEVQQRCREIDEDATILIPAQEVFAELRERFG